MVARHLASAVLEDRPLAANVIRFTPQATLQALSRTCRFWHRSALSLAPSASRCLALMSGEWPEDAGFARAPDGGAAAMEGGPVAQGDAAVELRRARLLESMRMSCQDPHVTNAQSVGSFVTEAAGEDCSAAESGADDWVLHRSFRDRCLTDEDLLDALCRAAPGDLRRIFVCGSQLSDRGVARALAPHWRFLQDFGMKNCRPARDRGCLRCGLTGASLSQLCEQSLVTPVRPLDRKQRFSSSAQAVRQTLPLRRLALVDLPCAPLQALARSCDLRSLMLRGSVDVAGIEALSLCSNLEVLRLTLEPRAVQDCFMRVFSSCHKLRVIDIYFATDVSDQLLGCIMLNVRGLEDFRGSHAGGSFSQGLSQTLVEAFEEHFRKARIFIHNRVQDAVL